MIQMAMTDRRVSRAILLAVMTLFVAGCGLKGDLYLPDEPSAGEQQNGGEDSRADDDEPSGQMPRRRQ